MMQTDNTLLISDSLLSDTLTADTVVTESLPPAMVYGNPVTLHEAHEHLSPAAANSWVLLALFMLFAAVCFRFKSNTKYFQNLLHELIDVRERANAFDDTVRETSFMWLLNAVCCIAGGIILDRALAGATPSTSILALLGCIGATAIYCTLMPCLYWLVGDIFTDRLHAKMWTQGFLASQAVLGVALLPLSLIAIFYPGSTVLLPLTAVVIIIAKILFISKGFRIFFSNYAYWVTFLYYLCSLEVVPLILLVVLASRLVAIAA